MGSLMDIRRMILTQQVASPSDWDYEWDYSMGLLSSNDWTKVTSGTASETLQSDGVRLLSNPNAYVTLRNPNSFNRSSGVIEVLFSASKFISGQQNFRICFSDGTNGIQVYAPSGGLRLLDSNSMSAATSLGVTLSSNTDYTIRLVLNNGYGQVWCDGVLLLSGIDVSTILYATNTSIWSQNQAAGYITVKSVKMKLGRI